jgi:hypothetical protein
MIDGLAGDLGGLKLKLEIDCSDEVTNWRKKRSRRVINWMIMDLMLEFSSF